MTKQKKSKGAPSKYELKSHDVSYVNITDEVDTWVTVESDGQMYGQGECTAQSHTITGLQLAEGKYGDIGVPFKVVEGETYYLLWASYNTGDSFSHQEGLVCFIDLFQSKEVAEENAKRCTAKLEEYSVCIKLDDGREYKMHAPWEGYFESLNFIEVLPLKLGGGAKRFTRPRY